MQLTLLLLPLLLHNGVAELSASANMSDPDANGRESARKTSESARLQRFEQLQVGEDIRHRTSFDDSSALVLRRLAAPYHSVSYVYPKNMPLQIETFTYLRGVGVTYDIHPRCWQPDAMSSDDLWYASVPRGWQVKSK
jgi:hypothetical protein